MTEDVIELSDTFNTKVCPDKIIFGDFNDKPIPSNYYIFLDDDNNDGNNNPGTPVDNSLPDNEGGEDAVMTDDE